MAIRDDRTRAPALGRGQVRTRRSTARGGPGRSRSAALRRARLRPRRLAAALSTRRSRSSSWWRATASRWRAAWSPCSSSLWSLATWWAAREIAPESAAVARDRAGAGADQPVRPALRGAGDARGARSAALRALPRRLRAPPAHRHARDDGGDRSSRARRSSSPSTTTVCSGSRRWSLNEAWMACGGPRGVFDRAVALARRIDLRRPFTLFVAISLLALAAIALTGGGTLRVGERAVSVTSIGNPLLVLVAIVLARAVWRPRRSWERWRRWEGSLAERHRVLLWTIAIPDRGVAPPAATSAQLRRLRREPKLGSAALERRRSPLLPARVRRAVPRAIAGRDRRVAVGGRGPGEDPAAPPPP